MEKTVIYGAGNTGKSAYYYFKNIAECLFFVDSDEKKWGGGVIEGHLLRLQVHCGH